MPDDKDIIPSTRGLQVELDATVEVPHELVPTPKPLITELPKEPVKPLVTTDNKPTTSAPPVWKDGDPIVISKVLDSGPGWLKVQATVGAFTISGGTISWRNNNPGNIEYGSFADQCGAVDKDYKGFAVFPTYEDGQNAQKTLLFGTQSVYYNLSLLDAIRRYAPGSDGNNPKEYANFVSRKAGIDRDTPLYKLTPDQQDALVLAMRQMEGFKIGKIEKQ